MAGCRGFRSKAKPKRVHPVPVCLWGCRAAVATEGAVCGDCLDREVRRLNAAIRLYLPGPGRKSSDALRDRIADIVSDRRRVMVQMTEERRRYWKACNANLGVPWANARKGGRSGSAASGSR
jgi:hypothetical protein